MIVAGGPSGSADSAACAVGWGQGSPNSWPTDDASRHVPAGDDNPPHS